MSKKPYEKPVVISTHENLTMMACGATGSNEEVLDELLEPLHYLIRRARKEGDPKKKTDR